MSANPYGRREERGPSLTLVQLFGIGSLVKPDCQECSRVREKAQKRECAKRCSCGKVHVPDAPFA